MVCWLHLTTALGCPPVLRNYSFEGRICSLCTLRYRLDKYDRMCLLAQLFMGMLAKLDIRWRVRKNRVKGIRRGKERITTFSIRSFSIHPVAVPPLASVSDFRSKESDVTVMELWRRFFFSLLHTYWGFTVVLIWRCYPPGWRLKEWREQRDCMCEKGQTNETELFLF